MKRQVPKIRMKISSNNKCKDCDKKSVFDHFTYSKECQCRPDYKKVEQDIISRTHFSDEENMDGLYDAACEFTEDICFYVDSHSLLNIIGDVLGNTVVGVNSYLDVFCENMAITRQISYDRNVIPHGITPYLVYNYFEQDDDIHEITDNITSIPYPEGSFSLVTCLNGFVYLQSSVAEFVKELFRITSPGGYLFVQGYDCINYEHMYGIETYFRFLDRIYPKDDKSINRTYRRRAHINEILTSAGFELQRTTYPSNDSIRSYLCVYQKPEVKKVDKRQRR